jgi:hypothetical protein
VILSYLQSFEKEALGLAPIPSALLEEIHFDIRQKYKQAVRRSQITITITFASQAGTHHVQEVLWARPCEEHDNSFHNPSPNAPKGMD